MKSCLIVLGVWLNMCFCFPLQAAHLEHTAARLKGSVGYLRGVKEFSSNCEALPDHYKVEICAVVDGFNQIATAHVQSDHPHTELNKEAEKSLSHAVENAFIGGSEIVLGVAYLIEGNIPSGGLLVADGVERMRDAVNDFKEAMKLQEDARNRMEIEPIWDGDRGQSNNYNSFVHDNSGCSYYDSMNDSQGR